MPDHLVSARHLSKVFRSAAQEVVAVRDATCVIEQNARIALFGPSGSGKSTLLQLLGGLDQPTSGTISWPAFASGDLRPAHIAFVFQNQTLLPALSALENVVIPLLLQGATAATARTRAQAALDRLQLAELAEKLPEELSGGQAQRVAFARALVVEPELILADEPTGQLDGPTANQLFEAVLPWIDAMNCAIVIATHDASVGARMQSEWTMRFGVLEGETTSH